MNKVLVLGYFGYQTNQLDGQTVKTRDVYRLAKEQLCGCAVDYFDTQELQKNKLLVLKMFGKVMRCDMLLYLPAHNNLKVFFPIIFILSFLCRVKIHYFVVGGWLREYLTHLPLHRFMLERITGIHVETKRLKNELEKYYGFKNVGLTRYSPWQALSKYQRNTVKEERDVPYSTQLASECLKLGVKRFSRRIGCP